jgi:hypothetical protein
MKNKTRKKSATIGILSAFEIVILKLVFKRLIEKRVIEKEKKIRELFLVQHFGLKIAKRKNRRRGVKKNCGAAIVLIIPNIKDAISVIMVLRCRHLYVYAKNGEVTEEQ